VPPQIASSSRREGGTASIELIGAVPFLLLAVLVAAQIAAAGAALWSAGLAARAGARAALVGGDARIAALRALPSPLRDGAEVGEGDPVTVRVPVPNLLPGLPSLDVGARASLRPGDG
jgi:hypothetical protein